MRIRIFNKWSIFCIFCVFLYFTISNFVAVEQSVDDRRIPSKFATNADRIKSKCKYSRCLESSQLFIVESANEKGTTNHQTLKVGTFNMWNFNGDWRDRFTAIAGLVRFRLLIRISALENCP